MKNYNILYILILFGILFIMTSKQSELLEGFGKNQCPDSLFQKEDNIFLQNTNLANIPGVNPVKFNNLEEYVEYTNWQRSQKMYCPVLSLQHYQKNSSQNYMRPSTDLLAGLSSDTSNSNELETVSKLIDSNRNDPPYNKNSYPGFDQLNQYIGLKTPLDEMQHQDINGISPNPMDSNWGGGSFTQTLIDKGYYADNNVSIKPA